MGQWGNSPIVAARGAQLGFHSGEFALSPEGVITEFVSVQKSYHCHRVTGDHYGGEFPREQFRKRNTTDQTIRS